jgi:hypothetical protein
MTGIFNYVINLEFVSEDKSKLLENIYKELDEQTSECSLLRNSLLKPELENGQIIFSGRNLQDWNYQCDEEVMNKVINISEKYNGTFVGKLKWWYKEHNYTFYENGKISTEFPN